MPHETQSLARRISRSVTGHLRVVAIALVFGLTAYGLVHLLIWAVRAVENM